MSPWPCRTLTATLCPDQVSVVQERMSLGRHGFARSVEWQHVVGVQADSDAPPWRAALETLAAALPARANESTAATAVLSNRFLRYTLVPTRADLVNRGELLAYARHRFAAVHGPIADGWDVRLSPSAGATAAVASAVDARLLSGLHDLFRRVGVRLASVQPRLMAVANGVRRQVATPGAWLALAEPGHLCLALLHHGEWRRLRTARHEGPWREQLCVLLDRECFQDGDPTLPADVYVWHAREPLRQLPQCEGWRFHAAHTSCGADPSPASSPLQ